MPIPERKQNEDKQKFVSRCMSNETMKKDYPNTQQRVAICLGQTRKSKSTLLDSVLDILGFSISYECDSCDAEPELLTLSNIIVPEDSDYEDFGEQTETLDLSSLARYQYKDPTTNELFYFDKKGNYKKNNKYLTFDGEANAAEYQGRKVTLNKPFRTPSGPKKFAVYTTNESGNVVIVRFGDPNMKIKKNIPSRRKSFRARHNCDNPGPKWKARYWSCKAW